MLSKSIQSDAPVGSAFLNLTVALFSIVLPFSVQAGDPGTDHDELPNVVFILADDLGWGDLAVYGNPRVETPNLDGLASDGVLLTQFYMMSPVCSPSRAAILTGRNPAELGIHYAIGAQAGDTLNNPDWLDPDLTTIYDVFRGAGYRTGHFGKWHLGADTPAGRAPPPEAYGLDVSATTNSTGHKLKRGERTLVEDTLGNESTADTLLRRDSSEAIAESAIKFIASSKDQPFLVSLWLLEPHAVLDPSEEQMRPYLDLTHEKVRDRYRGSETVYYASLTNIDAQLGKLFDFLKREGLFENTIVIFTSDNGPSPLWSKGTSHAGAGHSGPFRGVKGSLYEGGVRVPFIVSWPRKLPRDYVDGNSVVAAVDLLPTLMGLAEVSYSDLTELDGKDRSGVLIGQKDDRKTPLFWEYRAGSWGRDIQRSPRLAMRQGPWKLMMNPDGSRIELYNLDVDTTETSNVAKYEAEIVERMRAMLLDWFENQVPDHDAVAPHAGKRLWEVPGSSTMD